MEHSTLISSQLIFREMQDKMVKYWTNFAKYQNPTPNLDGINQEPVWLPYGKEKVL
jgi:hypothetical protein